MISFLALLFLIGGLMFASWCAGSADGYNEALRDMGFMERRS